MAGADVVVVGAGILGAACTARLSERGLRMTVLEQAASPALGSSGRSAAGVRTQFHTDTNILLSLHSIAECREMPRAEYRPVGYLNLVPPEAWAAHAAGVERQRALGAEVQVLTPHGAQDVVPFVPDGLHACTFGPQDGAVDPHGVTFTFMRQARERGARLYTDPPVTGLERRGEMWHVNTPRSSFDAP